MYCLIFLTCWLCAFTEVTSNRDVECVVGSKVYLGRDGEIFADAAVVSPCPSAECLLITYDFIHPDGTSLYAEVGACVSPGSEITCERLAVFEMDRWNATVANCRENVCTGHLCSGWEASVRYGCIEVPEDDIAVLPNCTLKEILHEYKECFDEYLAGYPYDNIDTCAARVDRIVQCMEKPIVACLAHGSCPTVFDNVPGTRQFHQLLLAIHYGTHSVDGLLQQLQVLGIIDSAASASIKELVLSVVCPTPGVVPAAVADVLTLDYLQVTSWFGIPAERAQAALPMYPCQIEYLNRSLNAYSTFARRFFSATSHATLCRWYDQYYDVAIGPSKTNCNVAGWNNWLYAILPQTDHKIVPMISNAPQILSDFFENYRIPNCSAGV